MKKLKLDKEETEIAEAIEQGKLKSLPGLSSAKKKYQIIAGATLNKNKNVNIRLSERDLMKIKSMASERGIPYQTLLTSLIHQYSTGQIKNKLL